jgi:spore germination cell wall hydrolase CwlJ-like protein
MNKVTAICTGTALVAVLAFMQAEIEMVGQDVHDIKTFLIQLPKDTVKYTSADEECLAKNIYYEAGFEPENGKYAVAQVTLNRLRTRQWGDSICSVVYSKAQFSWTLKKKLHKPRGDAWLESRWVAHTVLAQNIRVAPLQDATYYHADYVNPKWAKTVAKIQQVGTHIFYKKT